MISNRLRAGVLLLLPALLLWGLSLPPARAQTIPEAAHVAGKYSQLLKILPCAADQENYGDFADSGYFEATPWCGQQAPAGHWVYVAPNWYIWGQQQTNRPAAPAAAALQGKYTELLATVESCQARRASDESLYSSDGDAGYYPEVSYCGANQPAGYWVYVSPVWYIWKNKDLAAIGYQRSSQQVVLQQQTLTLHFEHQSRHQAWARENLRYVAQALKDMETLTGVPYPGKNPYLIEERPQLPLLGKAGPGGMHIKSPPAGTPWTFLHEVVHIWNAGQRPSWVIEGQANFLSFVLMQQNAYPFRADETYPLYIAEWRSMQGQPDDIPLAQDYDALPQGKAMAWWAMLYELYGPDVVRDLFQATYRDKVLSPERLRAILQQYSGKDPTPLLRGWIVPGPYAVRQTRDFGPVRYPLKQAWP